MRDELVFGAGWRGRPMAAQEAANAMREFLVGLARISSWEPPCDVSGSTKRPAPLAIAEDLSDFDDAVLKAMAAASFRASEAETGNVAPCAETAFGWCARFSDAPQRKTEEHTISIDIRLGASDRFGDSGIAIRVPSYKSYVEENGIWVMDELEHPQAVFEYLMDFLDPYCCAIHSTGFLDGISVQRSEGMGGLLLGPMSYTRSAKVRAALAGDSRVSEYRGGLLLMLNDRVDCFHDPAFRESAIEIRDKLRAAEATDWMEGADGHTARF